MGLSDGSGLAAEALLAALVLALFLKESVWWLRPDEAVLVRTAGGRWRAGFGARGFALAGREPYLLSPLQLHRPAWRLRWRMAAPPLPAAPLVAPPLPGGLAAAVWASAVLLFVGLPLAWHGGFGAVALLVVLAALYGTVLLALGLLWRGRAGLGLGGRALALLAFEALACVPYAPHLLRRAVQARPVAEDFTLAAARLLSADDWRQVRLECLRRIDEQIEAEPVDGPALQALRRQRRRFEPEAPTTAD